MNWSSASTSATDSTRLIAVRCDGHRADGLLVALVAHVDDPVSLPRAHTHLVVHLGDERAHGVDDVAAPRPRGFDDRRRRAVGGQHDRITGGGVGDVVDEHHTLSLEALDDQLVVDDLVVAVHRRFEGPDHPRQGLDRHLHTGAEPPRLGEQHAIDSHNLRLRAVHATRSLVRP